MTDNADNKIFITYFELNSHILAMLYLCYRFKFPISFMISFYENYKDNAFFVFKALSCKKQITLNDLTFAKIFEESRNLYKQILVKDIKPETFSEKYQDFIKNYLLVNIEDIYTETVALRLSTNMLYGGC